MTACIMAEVPKCICERLQPVVTDSRAAAGISQVLWKKDCRELERGNKQLQQELHQKAAA